MRSRVQLIAALLLVCVAAAALPASASYAAAQAQVATATPIAGDPFENNYRVEDAPRLAWGVAYDLSLGCPDRAPGACVSGDHDFFLVPVKRDLPFVALTYELGPGADTTLAIYEPAPGDTDPSTGIDGWRLVRGNDDAKRGATLRSQVLISPTWDGDALLIVAASDRSEPPQIPGSAGPPGRYRLMVGSPFLPALQEVLQAQQGGARSAPADAPVAPAVEGPAPTPAPLVAPTPVVGAADPEEIIREACLVGVAQVVNPDGASFSAAAAPARESRILMRYPAGSMVQLLGACYLGWVKALPDQGVSPGWMYAPDLALVAPAPPDAAVSPTLVGGAAGADLDLGAGSAPTNQMPTPGPLRVEPLPTLAPALAEAPPREAVTITVEARTQAQRPLAGLRVQLVDLYGQVLREGPTDAQGRIALVADSAAGAAIWLQVPALGLTLSVDRASPSMMVVAP